jgi:uncharacterized protein YndB with AHSA1/START domain
VTDDQGTFRYQLRIEAPPELVFSYFTDPAKMARWMGIDHKLDPVPGGVFMVDVNGRDVAMGEFVELDHPTRVVFTWGWREQTDVPPGSTTVEVNLAADGDATLLDFAHHGLPPDRRALHADGWNHYLSRLGMAAAGFDPGADTFAPPS